MKKIRKKVNTSLVGPVKYIVTLTKINLGHFELLIAAIILIATGFISGKGYVEWLGVVGVLLTFEYTIIAHYLAEMYEKGNKKKAKKRREKTALNDDYHKQLLVFYYLKELIWLFYFLLLGAWSALVGVILFIGYALWRKEWNTYHEVYTLDVLE